MLLEKVLAENFHFYECVSFLVHKARLFQFLVGLMYMAYSSPCSHTWAMSACVDL